MGLNVESLVAVLELFSFDSFGSKPGTCGYSAGGGIVHSMTKFKPMKFALRKRPIRGSCKCARRDAATTGIGS